VLRIALVDGFGKVVNYFMQVKFHGKYSVLTHAQRISYGKRIKES
jgi:hypothetical protein